MKRTVIWVVAIILCVALVFPLSGGCAAPAPTPAPTPAPAPAPTPAPAPAPAPAPTEFEWPSSLAISTTGLGTGGYTLATAVAPVMEKLLGIKVRVTPEEVEVARWQKFYSGEFDIDVKSSPAVEQALVGGDEYAGVDRVQARILWMHNDLPWGFVVLKDSDVKTIYDIKGKRVPIPMHAVSMRHRVLGVLDGLGLAEGDYKPVEISGYSECVRSIVEGKTDVTVGSPISAVTYEIEGNPRGIRWLDLPFDDKQLWDGILKYGPTNVPSLIGTGVETARGIQGFISPMMYLVLEDTDQELVYNLAKWFDENHDAYKDTHALALRMHADVFRSFLDFNFLPVAEGTIRYLKEIGQWTAEDDKWNMEAIELNTKYVEAYQAAVTEAKAKGIAVDAANEEWINLWDSHKEGLPRFRSRI